MQILFLKWTRESKKLWIKVIERKVKWNQKKIKVLLKLKQFREWLVFKGHTGLHRSLWTWTPAASCCQRNVWHSWLLWRKISYIFFPQCFLFKLFNVFFCLFYYHKLKWSSLFYYHFCVFVISVYTYKLYCYH